MSKKKDQGGPVVFLMNILANGPAPRKIIEERATVCGFSKDQLDRAKRKIGGVAFKEATANGQWLWCLPQHAPKEGS
jgi:hypothetical protein